MVRFVDSGDESDVANDGGLAPVTPLFGRGDAPAYPKTAAEARRALEKQLPTRSEGRSEWDDHPDTSDASTERSVVDILTGRSHSDGGGRARPRKGADVDADPAEAAERVLLKKLGSRQLSVSEARTYLVQRDLDRESAGAILETFLERGYLDDARLAEQVVHAAVDRKGQGRQVIAQSLAKRGVPRDVADAALAELPDDDAERALEFARTKAGSMRNLERDVALRRLAGQLARRGYGGQVALNAARMALDEAARPSGRVRFEEL